MTAFFIPALDSAKQDAEHAYAEIREAALEGLQDAVHRQSVQKDEQIANLQHRTEPHELARTMSDDARRRGI